MTVEYNPELNFVLHCNY